MNNDVSSTTATAKRRKVTRALFICGIVFTVLTVLIVNMYMTVRLHNKPLFVWASDPQKGKRTSQQNCPQGTCAFQRGGKTTTTTTTTLRYGLDIVDQETSCIRPFDIGMANTYPLLHKLLFRRSFINKGTPYFLLQMINTYGMGDPICSDPLQPYITAADMCSGLGYRLELQAKCISRCWTYWGDTSGGNQPSPSVPPSAQTANVQCNLAFYDSTSNAMLSSKEVYQKYGPPMGWQYPQWSMWLASRMRLPAMPPDDGGGSGGGGGAGTWLWGNPFRNTSVVPPVGCVPCSNANSNCAAQAAASRPPPPCLCDAGSSSTCAVCNCASSSPTCNNCSADYNSANPCWNTVHNGCWPSGDCQRLANACCAGGSGSCTNDGATPQDAATVAVASARALYIPEQTAENNPFVAFQISASAPIIQRFLGYGFEYGNQAQDSGGNKYVGGPASWQPTLVEQFLALVVNGGFYAYAEEDSNMDIAGLNNFLFGTYTYESKFVPRPKDCGPTTGQNVGKMVNGGTSGAMAGAGIGAMVAPESMGIGILIGALIGAVVGAGSSAAQSAANGDFTKKKGCP